MQFITTIVGVILLPCLLIAQTLVDTMSPNSKTLNLTIENCYPFALQETYVEIESAPAWAKFSTDTKALGSIEKHGNCQFDLEYSVVASTNQEESEVVLAFKDKAGDVFEYQTIQIQIQNENTIHVEGLGSAYPNPANPESMIQYKLAQNSDVKLEIYNILGQKIRSLVQTSQPAGSWQINWNGRDEAGSIVSSGVYFIRLQVLNNETKMMNHYVSKLLLQK